MIMKTCAGKRENMKRILEAFFMILIWLILMKGVDMALNQFINEIVLQNTIAVVAAFFALILSAWLSERIVILVKKYL